MPRSAHEPPLAEYLAEGLGVQAERVRSAADLLAMDGTPETLHAFRVQIRRLRSALRGARGVFGKFHVRAIERSLGELIDLTNPARDAEVLLPRLRDAGFTPEVETALIPPLERWQESAVRARGRLDAALAEGALNEPLEWLLALIRLPVRPTRNGPARKMARKMVRACADTFVTGLARLPEVMEDAETLHALRLAAKNLRYLIDFYRPLLSGRLRRLEPLTRRMQTELGNLHDFDVLISRLERLGTLPAGARQSALKWAREQRELHAGLARGAAAEAYETAATLVTRQ